MLPRIKLKRLYQLNFMVLTLEYTVSYFVGTIEKYMVFLIKTPIFQDSISSKIGYLIHHYVINVNEKQNDILIKNMLILIGPVIVGNSVHNFHTNWAMTTRWCGTRGQEISSLFCSYISSALKGLRSIDPPNRAFS